MNSSRRVSACLTGSLLALSALVAPGVQAQEPRGTLDAQRQFVAMLDSLPQEDLKTLYLQCSDAATRGDLDWGEIAFCSIVYERLLSSSFGGDFLALLAWSRNSQTRDLAPVIDTTR